MGAEDSTPFAYCGREPNPEEEEIDKREKSLTSHVHKIDLLEKELSDARDEIKQMLQQYTLIKQQSDTKYTTLHDQYETECEQKSKTMDELSALKSKYEQQIKGLNEEHQQSIEMKSQRNSQLMDQIETLQNQINEYNLKTSLVEHKSTQHETENAALREEIQTLYDTIKTKEQSMTNATENAQQFEKELKEAKRKMRAMTEHTNQSDIKYLRLEDEFNRESTEKTSLIDQLQKSQKRYDAVIDSQTLLETDIEQYKTCTRTLEQEVQSAQDIAKSLLQAKKDSEQKVDDLTRRITKYEEDVTKKTSKIELLHKELKDMNTKHSRLEGEFKRISNEFEQKTERLKKLQKERITANLMKGELEDEVAKLTRVIAEDKANYVKQEAKYLKLEERYNSECTGKTNLINEIEELRERYHALVDSEKLLKEEYKTSNLKLEKQMKRTNTVKRENITATLIKGELEEEINDMRIVIAQHEEDAAKRVDKIEQLESEKEKINIKYAQIEEEKRKVMDQLQATRLLEKQLQQKIDELNRIIEQLRNEKVRLIDESQTFKERCDELVESEKQLEQDAAKQTEIVKQLQKRVDHAESGKNEINIKYVQLEEQYQSELTEKASVVDQLRNTKAQVDELGRINVEHKHTNEQLQKELNDSRSKSNEMEHKYNTESAGRAQIFDELQKSKERCDDLIESQKQLDEQLQKGVANAESDKNEINTKYVQLEEQYRSVVDELSRVNAEHKQTTEQLQKELNNSRNKSNELEHKYNAESAEKAKIIDELRQSKERCDELFNSKKQLEEEREEQKNELKRVIVEHEAHKKQNTKQLEDAMHEIQQASNAKKDIQTKYLKLEEKLKQESREKLKLVDQLQKSRKRYDNMMDLNKRLQQEIDRLKSIEKQQTTLKEQVAKLKSQCTKHAATIGTLKQRISALQKQLAEKDEAMKQKEMLINVLTQENQSLKKELSTLKQKLQAEQKQTEDSDDNLDPDVTHYWKSSMIYDAGKKEIEFSIKDGATKKRYVKRVGNKKMNMLNEYARIGDMFQNGTQAFTEMADGACLLELTKGKDVYKVIIPCITSYYTRVSICH
eukprot:203961_1